MTKYREILRLASLGLSQQSIADSSGVSKKTVNRVLKRAKELNIFWPLEANETDAVLAEKLFPSAQKQVSSTKRMPDFNYIQKELLRNGVNKKLLPLWFTIIAIGQHQIPMYFLAHHTLLYIKGILTPAYVVHNFGLHASLFFNFP